MASRIKNLPIAEKASDDDYIAIDGATYDSRKISVTDASGGREYDFTSDISPSIDSRGVYTTSLVIVPVDLAELTDDNLSKIEMYLLSDPNLYPLIITRGYVQAGYNRFVVYVKSLSASPQSTSTSTTTGIAHVVAPFEISSVSYYK